MDLGNGVFVPKRELEYYTAFKNTLVILSRHLIKMVFSREELLKSSLYAAKCNANKTKETLPALDSKRLNSVIGMYVAK